MEQERDLRNLLVHSAGDLGLSLTEQQVAQFLCYLSQLTRWNETINLTRITDPQEIVIKHFIDSLTALTATRLPQNAILADVGSGGGFPGIPLKIMRNDLRLYLIESNHKKCSFLTSITGILKIEGIEVFHGTLREYCDSIHPLADVVAVRALRFSEFADQLSRILTPGGLLVLYRTAKLGLDELGNQFRLLSESMYSLPRNSGERVISVLVKN